jgi:hypothetical protein
MTFHRNTRRRIAVAAVVGSTLLVGGGTVAFAASNPSPSPSASSTPSTAPVKHSTRRTLLDRADHATLEVRRHRQWVSITVDRGNVTALSATSITLRRPDGQSVTIALAPTTRYRGKEASSATALKTGVRAQVISMHGIAIAVTEGSRPLPEP